MDDDEPTLKSQAEKVFYIPDSGLPASQIMAALTAAGIDPSDEKERRRFVTLVKANVEQAERFQTATIGSYIDMAVADLGEDASEDELYKYAMRLEYLEYRLRLQYLELQNEYLSEEEPGTTVAPGDLIHNTQDTL